MCKNFGRNLPLLKKISSILRNCRLLNARLAWSQYPNNDAYTCLPTYCCTAASAIMRSPLVTIVEGMIMIHVISSKSTNQPHIHRTMHRQTNHQRRPTGTLRYIFTSLTYIIAPPRKGIHCEERKKNAQWNEINEWLRLTFVWWEVKWITFRVSSFPFYDV